MTTDVATVLWTSGWDSTYRVAHLLLVEGRTVQPWYVHDEDRRSSKREFAAQARIRSALIAKDPTIADRLRPTIVHRLSQIPANPQITAKWQELYRRSFLGTQYDWLARLAAAQDVTLELSIHVDDTAHGFLDGAVRRDDDGVYVLADDADDALRLFERFRFPLFDTSKVEMQEAAERHGFGDVMEMTWFCAMPLLDGTPCGYCNPCRYTREEGLGRRIPPHTPWRRAQFLALSTGVRVRGGLRIRARQARARLAARS